MPLTAALLALVQAVSPAEPPDCAVYEGWFERQETLQTNLSLSALRDADGILNIRSRGFQQFDFPGGFGSVGTIEEELSRQAEYEALLQEERERLREEQPELFTDSVTAPTAGELFLLLNERVEARIIPRETEWIEVPDGIHSSIEAWPDEPEFDCEILFEVAAAGAETNFGQAGYALSPVAFSSDGRFAVIYTESLGEGLGGWGAFSLLEKVDGDWIVIGSGGEWFG